MLHCRIGLVYFQFPRLTHQLGYLSHLPQGSTFILIPLSLKLSLSGAWLGLPVSHGQCCPQCMSHSLDHFGHHALSCKNGSDVVSHHNRILDTLFEFCQRACLGAQLEAGSSLGHEARQTCPADVLVPNWELGKPAAIDLCVTSPLKFRYPTSSVCDAKFSSNARQNRGSTTVMMQNVHGELGWVCIPLAGRVLWKLGTRSST